MKTDGPFDVLTATAAELQTLLTSGTVTSVDIVTQYLAQIEKHNHNGLGLKAVISTAPKDICVQRARELDDERSAGKTRGSLHGIPVLLKDAIMTDESSGMRTTAGSLAFVEAWPKKSASVVNQVGVTVLLGTYDADDPKLLENGLIIIGKTNLTEFCGLRAKGMAPGWSAIGGSTKSPFCREGQCDSDTARPGGSSTGSAVGIAAGFAPLALGTETSGSTVWPASLNGLYALKPTVGSVDLDGVFALSRAFDCIGCMGKSAADVAALTTAVLTKERRASLPKGSLQSALTTTWDGLRVGILDPDIWGLKKGYKADFEVAFEKMRAAGAKIQYPVECPLPDTLVYQGKDVVGLVAFHEFKSCIEEFMAGFKDLPLRTLQDLVAYNVANKSTTMPDPYPDQADLIAALNNTTSPADCRAAYECCKKLAGPDGAGAVMDKLGLDVLVAPSGSPFVAFASCAGYPMATVPLGMLEQNDEPYGLFVLAKALEEETLIRYMAASEVTFPGVRVPPRLRNDVAMS